MARSRSYVSLKDNKTLKEHHSSGLLDEEIAILMDLSPYLVGTHRRALGLPPHTYRKRLIWVKDVHDPMLIAMHGEKKTDEDVSKKTGFSRGTVSQNRRRLGLVPITISRKGMHSAPPETIPKQIDGGKPQLTALQFAYSVLHGRFRTVGQNLILDDRPSNIDIIMSEANRVARKRGEPQYDKNPAWLCR